MSDPTILEVNVAPTIDIRVEELPRTDKIMQVKICNDSTDLNIGDSQFIFMIPEELNSYRINKAHAYVTTPSSAGTVTVQIHRKSDDSDILTIPITIDATEYNSYTATISHVVDSNNNTVGTGELICVDIDTKGTGTKGFGLNLSFVV